MDVLSSLGGGPAAGSPQVQPPATPPQSQAWPTSASAPTAPVSKNVIAYSPAIDDAPSPTPQSIITDTKNLPLGVQYAPSPAPHVGADARFDRSA